MAPPGVVYLSQRLPRVCAPPALIYLLYLLAKDFWAINLPNSLVLATIILSPPLALALSVEWTIRRDQRAAATLGAVIPPQVPHRWPGSVDILLKSLNNFKDGYPGDNMEPWINKLGHMFNVRVLFENRIFTTEPEHIKAILATDFSNFEKGPVFRFQMESVLGMGVFNADVDMWRFHRSMTRPFFSKERISHFDNFDRHAEDAIQQMKARFRSGHAIDFQDLISRFTLDSATEFLFGHDVQSLSAGLPYPQGSSTTPIGQAEEHPADRFARSFSEAQTAMAKRSRYGLAWPLLEFWVDTAKSHLGPINAFVEPILKDAVEKKRRDGELGLKPVNGQLEDTLLDHLVNYTQDQRILKDEILNMLVAGRDTTAGTLTFVIYLLSQHPRVLFRLRQEILAVVGSHTRPTHENLREMKYLRAVINETLRLFPIVPFNVRTSIGATTWPSKRADGKPYYIPARTRCPYSVFLMHRRTDLWGPDALEFDPDRFIDERLHKYLTPNPFIFLPFNAGPRICLGQQFAYNEISFMIVRLFQNFSSVSLDPDAQPSSSKPPPSWTNGSGRKSIEKIRPRTHLTMYALEGLWLKMDEGTEVE
ncbi:hypothetical protein JAAARDRAFT_37440 [Jaapia argillacea MUCL 33604]|uniref:Cytochrome P450 n=1 Tax=Jaapia argillacea MUCL 33604 TaxID=933084 RepID=A0A067PKW4_9AGAM|nr:hypothetical protein JAAARDRAFT_37440 [Jaapia argillacea MUCL 33604]